MAEGHWTEELGQGFLTEVTEALRERDDGLGRQVEGDPGGVNVLGDIHLPSRVLQLTVGAHPGVVRVAFHERHIHAVDQFRHTGKGSLSAIELVPGKMLLRIQIGLEYRRERDSKRWKVSLFFA